ncbi:M1 family metallopeptidase [Lysobacter sp. A3-1-A15]|uniref:M1 family metallopeptidase n=1 Tax=Novilysobacter viscosus TaxID=3098602 RepID=UPI002EDB0A70
MLAGCSRDAAPAAGGATPTGGEPAAQSTAHFDQHSYAEPGKVRIEDLALELAVDFDNRQLGGSATYTLDWVDPQATQLVLDTRDLTIEKVVGEREDGKWVDLAFDMAQAQPPLGSKLVIEAPQRSERIRVTYRTAPEASGLQWLTPAMTAGGEQPFMFSQSQQIHARSWVPLQDTPQVRFTYTAHVTSPKDVMVLMSADNDPQAERDGDYTFKMPQPIPSYLLAIAAGDLVFEPIGERSGVWAEPSMVAKAAEEFADTEKMIDVTEALYGPYRWERYDMLVLPPSFPYGGMENPRLSFITPTVIVGDKSLVSLIAHELAHSWSGNLVTFATANHGWLNEGVTSYVEGRIVEELYGKERADMETVIARNALREGIGEMSDEAQSLAIRPGVEPAVDAPMGDVAYDKGAWFLSFLEDRFGRAEFDAFLRQYFDHFAFQGIDSNTFIEYASENLLAKYPGKVTRAELEQWIYEPGIPESAPEVASPRLDAVDAARKAWLDGGELPAKSATEAWTTQEWVHFVEGLPDTLSTAQLAALDAAYAFTGTANGEVAQRWYPLAVRSGYGEADAAIAVFLKRVGRRKLIMPTYEALAATPEGLALAEDVLAQARPGYHPITTGSVDAVIAKAKGDDTVATPAD